MRLQEITDIYRQMGLGTQTERDELLKWSFDTPRDARYTTFFVETPNSDQNQPKEQEIEHAQLA